MNNLFFYKVGDTVLLARHQSDLTLIEAVITHKVAGAGKRPSLVKVQSGIALDIFGEHHTGLEGTFITPRKSAWLSTKEWEVRALVNRPKEDK